MRGLDLARQIQDRIMTRLGATEVQEIDAAVDGAMMGGTTRMGSDPRTSVVDADLRSHDHPNLFIVGPQVFPTLSANTPTLTVAALSARLGDFLTGELADTP